jgi:hypothetical protein
VGSLDLVVVLAPEGNDPSVAATVAEANRRGCQLIVFAPAKSLVAEHSGGRYAVLVPTQTNDHAAVAVAALDLLSRLHLGPEVNTEYLAKALEDVAVDCSPSKSTVNPAKILAIGLADSSPVLWGTSPLAARAARRCRGGPCGHGQSSLGGPGRSDRSDVGGCRADETVSTHSLTMQQPGSLADRARRT